MHTLAQLSLVTGAIPGTLTTVGLLALLWLAVGNRRHLTRRVPAALAVAIAATGTYWFLAERVWNLWGEPLPGRDYVFAGLGLFAVLLVVPKVLSLRRTWARLLVVPAAVVVLLSGAGLVNQGFEYYPTVGSLFGDTGASIKSLSQFQAETGRLAARPATARATTAATWVPPANMPAHGEVLAVHIPGTISHAVSSDAYVYLPPAYLGSPRANLPVLVLIHGVPGGSIDWLRGGQIYQFMDRYAAAHRGLAPVVVMPDAGARRAQYPPLCLDSRQGQGATYLTRDVPNWVKATFGAGTASPRQWAVGGFSYGGTCAMSLAVNHPEAYPTFIDSSGESRPTIGQGHAVLLSKYFGNSAADFAGQNALDVLARRSYHGVEGIVTVGATDAHYRPQGLDVYRAMLQAGIGVRLQEAPGGHAWPAWRYGVYQNMDWLMGRLGVAA
ncbi:alpha/beta hydrolase [Specibacter sp. RAF43]|uniref:alpha/beta hydrolase n=1 Tax=Specibacter sp. RAF43 TaxID=3233057 RepID=UPI003F954C88